ncbi:MAG: ABC transporter ATP-binding protein [Desulfofustis sp.]|nr:ABC transporter ATP-binding protein [Desulfofustis sp.]
MSSDNSPTSSHLLEARGILKDYDTFRAVHAVYFDIPHNCFVTILGPSGCGKTTILRMIGGFESITAGSIHLEGVPIMDVMPYDRPINTVFQNYALFPHLRVEDNVAFGLKMRRMKKTEIRSRVNDALESVRMASLARRYPSQLSGGQQQRVALARAFVNEPKLLLLDEPLGALDLKMRRHMQVELKDLQKRLALSFLYVTHDQEEAFALSDIIIVMNSGRIEQIGTPVNIYHAPENTYVADFIGGANLLEGRLTEFDSSARRGHLETEIGTVEAACSGSVKPDEPASLCFRAEEIGVDTGIGGDISFKALVSHIIFQGSSKLVEVHTGKHKLIAKLDHDVPVTVGEPIKLAVAKAKLRIVHGSPVVAKEIH